MPLPSLTHVFMPVDCLFCGRGFDFVFFFLLVTPAFNPLSLSWVSLLGYQVGGRVLGPSTTTGFAHGHWLLHPPLSLVA